MQRFNEKFLFNIGDFLISPLSQRIKWLTCRCFSDKFQIFWLLRGYLVDFSRVSWRFQVFRVLVEILQIPRRKEFHRNFRDFRFSTEISYISPEFSRDFRFLKFYVEIFIEISGIFIVILQIPARFVASLEILGTRMIICRVYGCRVVFFVALYIFSYVSYFHPFDRSFILQWLNLVLWGEFSWERFEELQYKRNFVLYKRIIKNVHVNYRP